MAFTATGVWRGVTFTAAMMRDLATAVARLDAWFGDNPQGDHDTVVARLDANDALVQANLAAPLVNLKVTNNAVSPTTKLDVTATIIAIQGVTVASFAGTVDINVSGLNGLDTGSPGNKWYQLWAIYNQATTADGLILTDNLGSSVPTTPSLPSGFTLGRMIHRVYRTAGGAFLVNERRNQSVRYGTSEASDYFALTAGPSASYTASGIDFTKIVPPGTTFATLQAYISATFAGAGVYALKLRRSSADAGFNAVSVYSPSGSPTVEARNALPVRLGPSLALEYAFNSAPATLGGNLLVLEYEDPV